MNEKQITENFWLKFDDILTEIFVPRFSSDIARPCEEEDFQEYREAVLDKVHHINRLLDIIQQNKEELTDKNKKILIKVIIIVGEQHCKNVWNTSEIVEISKFLLLKICKIYKNENITEMLKNDEIFSSIILFLRPKLLKDTWKSFPAAVICYKWLLEIVEKPLLKRHVTEILPTGLIIFDDYVQENQILGLKCINIIIEHCQKSRSLKNFNYDEVILQALEKMACKVEPNLIIPLYSCIYDLLENMRYYEESYNIFGWTKHDDILSILLDNMELQTNFQARYAYVISLKKFLNHSSSGKWTERLTRILSEYCEDNTDDKITDASLDLVREFLSVYQPKGPNFYIAMNVSFLKLRHKLISSERDCKEILKKVDQCISLLSKLSPNLHRGIMSNNIVQSVMAVT